MQTGSNRLADLSPGVCPENGASLHSSFYREFPPEMLRLSGMPIKIKDRPLECGSRL